MSLLEMPTRADDAAVSSLFEAERSRLFNYCARMVGDRAMAEDLAQEVFVKALLALRRRPEAVSDSRASLATWLFTIAHRHCLDHLRRRGALRRMLDRLARFWWGASERIEDGVLDRALGDRLLEAVSPRERSLLIMAHGLGFTHAEIAEAHGLTVGSVGVLLHRARVRAAAALKEVEHV